MGGTMDNKVVHTLVRAFVLSGWRAVRFNFRGVGRSAGSWDEGRGESSDLMAVVAHFRQAPELQGFALGIGWLLLWWICGRANLRAAAAGANRSG